MKGADGVGGFGDADTRGFWVAGANDGEKNVAGAVDEDGGCPGADSWMTPEERPGTGAYTGLR